VARNPGIRRSIRRCYRTLIMVTSLAVVMGLAATAAPARATSLPAIGDSRTTQNLSSIYDIPTVSVQQPVTGNG
jgi:hypothetical protein